MNNKIEIVKSNTYFLNQGVVLLSTITDEQYSFNNGKLFKSGIGRHFRHIIEHYLSLINGYTSKVNYDVRDRDLKLETDRKFAINTLRKLIDSIEIFEIKPELIENHIEVTSNDGSNLDNPIWSKSTIRRELQFLISHTVHHYALIGLILKIMGVFVQDDFGKAPSTIKYELSKKESLESS